MFSFILQILIMLSLGMMVYLIGRAVPRLSEEESSSEDLHERLNKIIARIPLNRIDIALSSQIEKILRKTKLFLMKLDNLLTNHLNKMKKPMFEKKEEKPNLFASTDSLLEEKD